MSQRDIHKLSEAFEPEESADKKAQGVSEAPLRGPVPSGHVTVEKATVTFIEINYPDPTPLSQVLRDVARWSNLSFVMEPASNVRIQIFAPQRLPPHQAYELFLAALSVVGLRAVRLGQVVKIVPMVFVVSA